MHLQSLSGSCLLSAILLSSVILAAPFPQRPRHNVNFIPKFRPVKNLVPGPPVNTDNDDFDITTNSETPDSELRNIVTPDDTQTSPIVSTDTVTTSDGNRPTSGARANTISNFFRIAA